MKEAKTAFTVKRAQNADRKKKEHLSYSGIRVYSKIGPAVFTALTIACAVIIVLLILIYPIVLFVNVEPGSMILPPVIRGIRESGILTDFAVKIADGVGVTVSASGIGLGDIKAVIYAFLLYAIVCFAVLFTLNAFLTRLANSIKRRGILSVKNADTVNVLGLAMIFGSLLIGVFRGILNLSVVRHFCTGYESARYELILPLTPFIFGVILLLLGCVYGYACATAASQSGVTETPSGNDAPSGDVPLLQEPEPVASPEPHTPGGAGTAGAGVATATER